MSERMIIGALLGVGWGVGLALALQYWHVGRFVADRVTWLSVVIGVGVDLLIIGYALGWPTTINAGLIIAASAGPIVYRSLYNMTREYQEMLDRLERYIGHADPDR